MNRNQWIQNKTNEQTQFKLWIQNKTDKQTKFNQLDLFSSFDKIRLFCITLIFFLQKEFALLFDSVMCNLLSLGSLIIYYYTLTITAIL